MDKGVSAPFRLFTKIGTKWAETTFWFTLARERHLEVEKGGWMKNKINVINNSINADRDSTESIELPGIYAPISILALFFNTVPFLVHVCQWH